MRFMRWWHENTQMRRLELTCGWKPWLSPLRKARVVVQQQGRWIVMVISSHSRLIGSQLRRMSPKNEPRPCRQGNTAAILHPHSSPPPKRALNSSLMSELKRKREEDDPEEEEPDVKDATPVALPRAAQVSPTAVEVQPATAKAAAAPRESTASEGSKSEAAGPAEDTAAPGGTGPPATSAEKDTAGVTSSGARRGKSKPPTTAGKITICGKEITLQHTGGRKKRKHPMETLILLAYKDELTIKCKANNMVSALEIHQEMKSKGIKQDLSVRKALWFFCCCLVANWMVLLFPRGKTQTCVDNHRSTVGRALLTPLSVVLHPRLSAANSMDRVAY